MYLLHIRHATGYVQVLSFASRYERALAMIRLTWAPVTLRIADY